MEKKLFFDKFLDYTFLLVLIFLFIFLYQTNAIAGWNHIGDVERVEKGENRVDLYCGQARVQIIVLSSDLIRVRMIQSGNFGTDYSWAVAKKQWDRVDMNIKDTDEIVELSTIEVKVVVQKRPCRISFVTPDGEIISQDDPSKGMGWDDMQIRCWKDLQLGDLFFGLGEKAGTLEKYGKSYVNWNIDAWNWDATKDPMYQSHPFFLGRRGERFYGIFFDNTYRSSFDFGKESNRFYSFGAEGGEMNYYFFAHPHPKQILRRFMELIGQMPLPPRWSLGYQQCRYAYDSERWIRFIAENFRFRNIPCDVLYLDILAMDESRTFTWNKQNFPDVDKLTSDLAKQGFKIAAICDFAIKKEKGYFAYDTGMEQDVFLRNHDGSIFTGQMWPGESVFPDFTKEQSRLWWGDCYKGYIKDGIRGFWNDMNEPVNFGAPGNTFPDNIIFYDNGLYTNHLKSHNVYGLLNARATYEGIKRLRENERPFVLTRAGFTGVHRYAAVWTGDNRSTWEHARLNIPILLSMSISGIPFVGCDIGGYEGSPTGELFTRWLQQGVFTPFFRDHTSIRTEYQEPWEFGIQFRNICRSYIELRYRLLPYIYSVFYQCSQTGIPIMRPLFLEFPDDSRCLREETSYLFGDYFYVAPIVQPEMFSRTVYLPPGQWINYWTMEKYEGRKTVTVDAPIDKMPLFVKKGAIIPMQQVMQYSDEEPINPLTVDIYPAYFSTFTFYEDDGISFNYKKGEFRKVFFKCQETDLAIDFSIGAPEGSYVPPKRSIVLKVNGIRNMPEQVAQNRQLMISFNNIDELNESDSGWFYDEVERILWIRIPDENRAELIRIQK